ncbi:MAG: cobyrinate a,c-diamide synthase [Lachnospiraceae bacterium]|nr:cobyrinate a,c-diamide synthase [Lachnospiraceae bacterium]MDD7327835.1 cobyrinate a,c-diamide synthase [Lachnospiraceae bacterium]MDY2760105.1 cobyrinate a,c-diamide synthase [Lachnospiraceae bacterium]
MHGFMIAADRSGSGKTTVTRAVMLSLKEKGYSVCPFKCGPDYIDPMYHSVITGVPGHNLDTFFTDEETTRQVFARDLADAPEDNRIAIAEGVMGLYDGVTGFKPEGSSYDLARVLGMPIILCINARGAAQTLLAVISGILSFDKEGLIRGIFLNQVSDGFAPVISERIEEAFGIPVVGHFPVTDEVRVDSRHLGLVRPYDIDVTRQNSALLQLVDGRVNWKRLSDISEMPDIEYIEKRRHRRKVRIAIAKDDAFDFFYRENEIVLEEMGADLVYFSPVKGMGFPEDTGGIILPGGYPELYADMLADNRNVSMSIREADQDDMPILAECGGFMYLHETIDGEGPMVEAISGNAWNTHKSQRFGYLSCYDKGHHFVKRGHEIRGHEFHYYDTEENGEDAVVMKPYSDKMREAGFCDEKSFMSFLHFYYPSYPAFAKHFVDEANKYARRKEISE